MKEVGHIFISKIKIQNIKGKATWENTFDGLCSNKVNLFVAPNGFGNPLLQPLSQLHLTAVCGWIMMTTIIKMLVIFQS